MPQEKEDAADTRATTDPPGDSNCAPQPVRAFDRAAAIEAIAHAAGAPPDRRRALTDLLSAALRRVPDDQLREIQDDRHIDGAAQAAREAFEFIDGRTPDEIRVRVRPGAASLDGAGVAGSTVEVSCDDVPFLLSSVQSELGRLGFTVLRTLHPVLGIERDTGGHLVEIVNARDAGRRESFIQMTIAEHVTDADAGRLESELRAVVHDVFAVAADHADMRRRSEDTAESLRKASGLAGFRDQCDDAADLLDWLLDENFVLVATCAFELHPDADSSRWQIIEGSQLGLLRDPDSALGQALRTLHIPELADLLRVETTPLVSTVDRRLPIHSFDVATLDPSGAITGGFRLLGVFTRKAGAEPAATIPVVRSKLERILELEDVVRGSHDEAKLASLFQVLPRGELFTKDAEALRGTVTELLLGGADDKVRTAIQVNEANRTVSVLIAVPPDTYTPTLRRRLERFLLAQLDGDRVEVDISFVDPTETIARFLVHVTSAALPEDSLAPLEREVQLLCRTWQQELETALSDRLGGATGSALAHKHADRFPPAYRDAVTADVAADDVLAIEQLAESRSDIHVELRRDPRSSERARLEVFTRGFGIELSQFLPIVESLGLWVVNDLPYDLTTDDEDLHLHDFSVEGPDAGSLDVRNHGPRLAEAALALWHERADVDSLNRLVLTAGLDWRDVAVFRALRRYRVQVGTTYTSEYINSCLTDNPGTVRALRDLFRARFDPEREVDDTGIAELYDDVVQACDAVERLDHDRILRGFLALVMATVRSNRYFRDDRQHPADYLAFKIDSAQVPDVTAPVPFRELFVFSPTVEGVHLRWGPVARGGLRWSDRYDDYRSEILDLMRAQVLKNALIVPTGAKGGFVVKRRGGTGDIRDDVRRGYKTFVTGMLELTDNVVDGNVVGPPRRYDGDDPYLVVAADRGTAAFSDIANAISEDHGFWLGDAFASGGSRGYDHKKLGITARGAWVAVTEHFRDLDIDVQTDPVTVVGIGDMSGDVFGNAMLCSDALRLVAAFDHRDIFIDPDPDPRASYRERRRLFETQRSTWQDYDRSLLSAGGGVWSREAKSIELPEPVRELIGVSDTALTPAELISALLRARVDLLFAGGIGTFVRASTENDADIIDRSNAAVRVRADQIRARVVGEGANLAFTQRARVEFARRGGRINIDAVDNSAGVDISDHEVNIKILLRAAVRDGVLDEPGRDAVLDEVCDDVVGQVLRDCLLQTLRLGRELTARAEAMRELTPLVNRLDAAGVIDRDVEELPTDAEMQTRLSAGAGYTRPELAVVMAGAKRELSAAILDSELPDQPAAERALFSYFPDLLRERFAKYIRDHRLHRELIASVIANDLVDRMGITFASTVSRETETPLAEVAAAYWLARGVADAPAIWATLEAHRLDPVLERDLAHSISDLLDQLARDYVRTGNGDDIAAAVERDRPTFVAVEAVLTDTGTDARRRMRARLAHELEERGCPHDLARRFASLRELEMVPDVAELSRTAGRDAEGVADALLLVSDAIGIDRIAVGLQQLTLGDDWDLAARRALLDDLDDLRRRGTLRALDAEPELGARDAVHRFLDRHRGRVEYLDSILRSIESEDAERLEVAAVATRAVRLIVESADNRHRRLTP